MSPPPRLGRGQSADRELASPVLLSRSVKTRAFLFPGLLAIAACGGCGCARSEAHDVTAAAPASASQVSKKRPTNDDEAVSDVQLQATTTDGDIDATTARRIVRAHVPELRRCHRQWGLREDAESSGRLLVRLAVTESHAYPDVRLVSSTFGGEDGTNGDELHHCVVAALRRWDFRKAGFGTVEITVTLAALPG